MQEELGKYIADLLYQHDRLNIPGLGSFELTHAPALVDQVQGQVSAPTKAVRFNENLVLDDGILIDYLQQQNGWTLSTTQEWLRTRVEGIKKSLAQKEIVEIPGVGRFFRNFEQQLQFVAESENFNIESFGLQPVRGQLVQRSRVEKIPASKPQASAPSTPVVKPAPAAGVRADQVAGGIAKWFQGNLTWLLGLSLAIIALAIYLMFLRPGPTVSDPVAEVPQERLNASPSKSTPPAQEDVAENDNTTTEKLPSAPSEEETNDLDTEAPTMAAEEHTAVIAVGLFGNPDNVQKLMQRLSEDGYAPVSRKEGGNSRIGVSVRFTTEAELQQVLQEVRKDYAENAFLLSRDGKSLR
ncbi:SPOR domain-containing protein [Lewinella cohaerens]|uniref:HU domain-containing protein n=1 Tax=Lewinella cohaerens TaxID=70995 RepID=UPI00037DC550|nr:SPOR domain-containing protein [Lewinella cohaerens]